MNKISVETHLAVEPALDLAINQSSDTMITEINETCNNLYIKKRQHILHMLRNMPSLIDLTNKLVEGKSYQAVISPEIIRRIKSGAANLNKSTNGLYGAIVRDNETGKIIAQVKLQEISPELLTSLNELAVQHALADIVQLLEIIDHKITAVLEGQRNDRLALIESGINLYQQAIASINPDTRHQLLISSIDQLNEGRQKLVLDLLSDIKFFDKIPRTILPMIKYSPFKDVYKEIEAKAKAVQQSFKAILKASCVLASAYETLGEINAFQVSLQALRDTVLKVGEKGKQIARFLPYESEMPPEELWHGDMLKLADVIIQANKQIETIDSNVIEVTFTVDEIGNK